MSHHFNQYLLFTHNALHFSKLFNDTLRGIGVVNYLQRFSLMTMTKIPKRAISYNILMQPEIVHSAV